MNEFESDLHRLRPSEVQWLPYPLVEGAFFRVLKVEEEANVVVLNFKMPPHSATPLHTHHCVAMGVTLAGAWSYENLDFVAGDIAFEGTTVPHRPMTQDSPMELLTIFFGGKGDDVLIEDINEDGSRVVLKTKFFKAVERITAEQFSQMDFAELLV